MGDSIIKALDNVSLEIEEGGMVGIIGTSGCGKSTLMNILGCLDRPDSGQYFLAGEDVSRLNKDRLAEIRNQYIGFVFQSFNLLSRMSALENIELPLYYAGKTDTKKTAEAALKSVGLSDRMHHEPNQLSGGERQRLAIARALVNNPSILLANEPTGNLDSKTSKEIMNLFVELNAYGRTIIVVTHDPEIVSRCRRIIRMTDGRIEEQPNQASRPPGTSITDKTSGTVPEPKSTR
jgi:putative ABC transport system ATP-binding protein